MKYIFSFFFFLYFASLHSQVVNLGTTHFRNERYLISFDKNMYPGYELVLENIHVREYLYNTLISDSLYVGKEFLLENEPKLYQTDYVNLMIVLKNGELQIDLDSKFEFTNDYKILNESYELEEYGLFEKYFNSQIPFKRLSNNNNAVEEVLINYEIDYKTNKIIQTEQILNTRLLNSNEVADIDRNIYTVTKIGSQVWFSENLRTTKFNDGTIIPTLTYEQWQNSTAPAILTNNPEGNFYNFYTLVADKNVCPQGFHVPTEDDVELLYNTITPYGDEVKINGNNVKIKKYSPWLTPITYPLLSAVHLTWWSAAIAVDVSLFSAALAVDATKFGIELVTSPFFGWQTKKKQQQLNLEQALINKLIDQNGYPLKYNSYKHKYERMELVPINKNDWSKFNVVKVKYPEFKSISVPNLNDMNYNSQNINSNYYDGDTISNSSSIDSLKAIHIDVQYDTKFNVFYNRFSVTSWFANSEYFTELNGLLGAFNFSAYQSIKEDFYPTNLKAFTLNSNKFKYNHLPVLTLLLQEEEEKFANQYAFNLNYDNFLIFATNNKNSKPSNSTGISYINYGFPGYFGISSKSRDLHELSIFNNLKDSSKSRGEIDVYRTQTRVRCVND